MILPIFIRVAFDSLRATRVRTALTTLGIVVGVSAVTFVLAVTTGIKNSLEQKTAHLGAPAVIVAPQTMAYDNEQASLRLINPFPTTPVSSLGNDDVQTISNITGVEGVAPIMITQGALRHEKDRTKPVPIIATTETFALLFRQKVVSGQFFDKTSKANTLVLGHKLAQRLLGTTRALSQQIHIKGKAYTVIGVVKSSGSPLNLAGIDLDEGAFLTHGEGESANTHMVYQQIAIKTASGKEASVKREIEKVLTAKRGGEKDFVVADARAFSDEQMTPFATILSVVTTIAAVSLVVGGIGIMNIMLVNVSERTREIGIRKSIGATNKQVMLQFLVEALSMTIAGGIIGVLVAYGSAYFFGVWFDFVPYFSWWIVALALGMSVTTGVIFGLYPALKAARKHPISALRHYL